MYYVNFVLKSDYGLQTFVAIYLGSLATYFIFSRKWQNWMFQLVVNQQEIKSICMVLVKTSTIQKYIYIALPSP